jgi:hypothetical protein
MGGFRFSIAALFLIVAAIGGGLAALRAPSQLMAGLITLAMLAVILVAVLGVVCFQEESRVFSLGVALFGCTYFVVVFTPIAPTVKSVVEQPLSFHVPLWDCAFVTTFHCLVNFLFALFGGILGRILYYEALKHKTAAK